MGGSAAVLQNHKSRQKNFFLYVLENIYLEKCMLSLEQKKLSAFVKELNLFSEMLSDFLAIIIPYHELPSQSQCYTLYNIHYIMQWSE